MRGRSLPRLIAAVALLATVTTFAEDELSPTQEFAASLHDAEQMLIADLADKPSADDQEAINQFVAGAAHHAWALSETARQLAFPRFTHSYELIGMPGLVNPDTHYSSALLEDHGSYTISGIRGNHAHLTFQIIDTFPMIGANRDLMVIDMNSLGIESGEPFTLHLGGTQREGRWWPLPKGARALLARQTFSDWQTQSLSRLAIQRHDTQTNKNEMPRMRLAAQYLSQIMSLWSGSYLKGLRRLPVNAFPPIRPSAADGGGLRGQQGVITRFRIGGNEAAIVKVRKSDADYQSIQIGDRWFVTPNPLNRLSSLNATQASVAGDGYFYFVISQQDPGVNNWLDASSIDDGYIMIRWQAINTPLTKDDQPDIRIVPATDVLRHLTDAQPLSSEERIQQLLERRALPSLKHWQTAQKK